MTIHFKKLLPCMLVTSGLSAFAASEAHAIPAFAGVVNTSICPGGAMVPRNPDRIYFDNGGGYWGGQGFNVQPCYATIWDTGNPSAFHWARFSIPVTPGTSGGGQNITTNVMTLGNTYQTVCSTVYAYTSSGAFSGAVNIGCNASVPLNPQCASVGGYAPCLANVNLTGAVTLPANGSILIDVAGKNATEIRRVSVTYTMAANG